MKDAIITSSVLILCMVLLRRLCRKKISAKLQYMLWLVVAIRLVMPGIIVFWPNLLPESAYSVLNAADRMERAAQEYIRPSEQPVQGSLPSKGLPFLTEENDDGKVVTYLTEQTMWLRFLEKVWYLGMAAIAFWMIAVNFRFMRRLYESRRRYQREGFELPVYTTKELSSPCLYGMPGRQAVYLPEDMTEDENGVRHILAHEYCHYKQKDILWSMLRCILLTVYWFHPLVWLAAVLSKQDCELACDEAAVRMLGEEERIAYGKTLVSLITRKTKAEDIVCTATTMTADAKGIKERLQRIAESPRRLAFIIVPMIIAIAVVVVLTYTQSKDYPEGVSLLEGEGSMTVTTDCFQITFPDSFIGKAYCREENDTDIIVYHKDSGLEVGRFCEVYYEEAVALASQGKEMVLIGSYGSNDALNSFMTGDAEGTEITHHSYFANGTESAESNDSIAGVPGTDSNEAATDYFLPEVETAGETAAWKASGDVEAIPAPELVEKDVIYLPYDENEDYNAVTVGDENHEAIEDGVEYLPTEQITTEVLLPAEKPCYLYIPADNAEAASGVREELYEMNQSMEELADDVIVLYVSRKAMEETLSILVENRTPYVGDNVRVSQIAGSLPSAAGLSYQFLELKTSSEPYEATLHYHFKAGDTARMDSDIFFLEAALIFSAVENLEICNIRIYDLQETGEGTSVDPSKMQSEMYSYERTDMEALFGTLYPCSESKETITELYNRALKYLEDDKMNALE